MKLTAKKINTKETKKFISILQKDDSKEDQIIWHIRTGLTDKEKKILMDGNTSGVVASTLCIHMVLMEVENMYYEDNTSFVIERGAKTLGYGLTQKAIKDHCMDAIFDEVQAEIWAHVGEYYFTVTEEDAKNS